MLNIFKNVKRLNYNEPDNVMNSGYSRMSTIIQSDGDLEINGVKYNVKRGSKVDIINDKVYINGVLQSKTDVINIGNKPHMIEVIINGNVNNIECNGSVNVAGDCAGNIDCEGGVTVGGDVNGDIDASGSVTVNGSVDGDVDASGSVTIKGSVGGNVDASGSVRIGGN